MKDESILTCPDCDGSEFYLEEVTLKNSRRVEYSRKFKHFNHLDQDINTTTFFRLACGTPECEYEITGKHIGDIENFINGVFAYNSDVGEK